MGAHLLVTAFEPFGPIRGNVPGLRGNRSEEIARRLESKQGAGTELRFQVLPVEQSCTAALDLRLSERPAGVLLMGEALLANVRLETRAADPEAQWGPVRRPGASWKTSAFAESLVGELEASGVSTESGIGTYECNRAYWHALGWAEKSGSRPVVFLHVGLFGAIDTQLAHVERVLQRMSQVPLGA